jgi:hypothetical protein
MDPQRLKVHYDALKALLVRARYFVPVTPESMLRDRIDAALREGK